MVRLVAAVLVVVAASGCRRASPADTFVRPVVVPGHPLALANPQREVVVWPIWGAAFATDAPVAMRALLCPGGRGGNGLVVAGPGPAETRVSVQLIARAGRWSVRELDGPTVIQERELAAPSCGALVVSVGEHEVTVSSTAASARLALGAPLGARGTSAGVYVYLEPGGTLAIHELALDQPLPGAPELGPPLRTLARARGLDIGSAIDVWPPLHDLGFESILGEQFNAVAPTELYWTTTRGEDADFFFVPADLSINYALVHDQTVTGMFLVWDFELPAWLDELARTRGADALGDALDRHIGTLVTRYRGQVNAWVVVNEAIWGPDETGGGPAVLAKSVWLDELGPSYIERAFRMARAADPDALLLYNETGAETLGPKSDFLYALLKDLLARGVPIDGIGLQFHVKASDPPDPSSMRANLERFARLGLEVFITELDVSITGTSRQELERQAGVYAEIVETCLAVTACRHVTVFGVSDRHAWDELGEAAPLLFDASYAPKPAFRAVQRALE
jgi:endo-1,4-beta-xylanase